MRCQPAARLLPCHVLHQTSSLMPTALQIFKKLDAPPTVLRLLVDSQLIRADLRVLLITLLFAPLLQLIQLGCRPLL